MLKLIIALKLNSNIVEILFLDDSVFFLFDFLVKIFETMLKYNRDNHDPLKLNSNIVEVLFFRFYVFFTFY